MMRTHGTTLPAEPPSRRAAEPPSRRAPSADFASVTPAPRCYYWPALCCCPPPRRSRRNPTPSGPRRVPRRSPWWATTSTRYTKGAFYEVFEPVRARELVRRLEFCYTPKHGSWLNIAENELGAMTRQCLRERRIGDLETLHGEVSAWSSDINGTQRGVDWQMRVDDARCKLKSVYQKIVM